MLDKYYKESKIELINKIIIMILLFMLCTIPIVMYKYNTISYSPLITSNMYSTGNKTDIFNFFKSLILNIGSFSILILFMYKLIILKDDIKNSKLNILVMVIGIMVGISALLSKYPDIALFGNFDRHEGAVSWISFLVIFFVLYNTKIDEKYYKYFYYMLVPFIFVNLILGLIKICGYNILSNNFINSMLGGGLGGELFTTLYHYNFGSTYSAIIFSVSFLYMILEKNKNKKIFLLIISLLSFTTVLTMMSVGGFVTILVILPISIVIGLRFTTINNVLTWSTISIILNTISYIILNNINPVVYDESIAIISKINDVSVLIIPIIILVFIGLVYLMKFVNRKLLFNIIVGVILVFITSSSLFISNKIEKEKEYIANNPSTNIVRLKDNELYQSLNNMTTDRLNIWMKTIDLINNKPIIGHGPDTYPYVIPIEDEDGAISSFGQYIDKPHNWYLTIAYNSGIIALASLVGIIIYIIKETFYNLSDKKGDKYLYIFAIGVIAYAVQGLYNDSLIGTAIIFWIYAGLSVNILKNIK